ncbi:hypothetical protein BCR36DRAFT_318963 [Piromyces finnis]|uniref:PIH1 N-terminal domain-containing protein n=1 Tax=Piromyces finnis TaxID=1754191 RepID=A0A1Y1VLC4_9FUNG|nr:hypothetical protein BCR36DRAFT_318963 [Piromyces finnis]|eukprot:ORX57906.1 hypothetical protein BCR36DRAFT_318963 [Piromyces finnis]
MDFDAKIPPNFNDMARNLWSQLDSMAKNNPKGYKELMTKIEEEAKKTLIPVLPTIEQCFSIKLEGTVISGSKVHYINFCKCNAVEERTKENDGGIPIVVREEDGKRKYRKYGRTFHVYDVSFNENILKRAEADPFFKRNLIFMAINCVEQVFNISFKKDFTVTEEKYNGTFIHGHTSREGQPMPTLSQEEVNELLKNASTILNKDSKDDENGKKKSDKNKNKNEKPIELTPESILKQHKTYQEEIKKNENEEKINPEVESTIEKLFFSDEKSNSDEKENNEKSTLSKSKSSLIEEMKEIIPESKNSEKIDEKNDKNIKSNKDTKKSKDGKNKNTNQYIELEGNNIPKIIDLLNDDSSKKDKSQKENNAAINEEESKIFDFLKEFDNSPGKIVELDESNNELPPSKIEELNKNDELPPSKIEELNKNDELPPSKIEELNKNDELPPSKIEELNKNDELPPSKIEELNESDELPPSKIEELNESDELPPSKIEELNKNDELPPSKIENNNIKIAKSEETIYHKDNIPSVEEVIHNQIENINNNNNNNILNINNKTQNNIDGEITENQVDLKKESIQEQLEKEQKQLIDNLNRLAVSKNDDNKAIQFKTIEIPVKEKPKYILKTSEHFLYIKIKLPKLKLIKSLQWDLSDCELKECRPSTEKWLNVSSPEYDLKIRLDTQFLDIKNIRVTFTKSTQMLILRLNRILN